MTDTPDDPPWITGPPPDYSPPPITELIDPAVRDETDGTATTTEGEA